jgi:hypothetical protein
LTKKQDQRARGSAAYCGEQGAVGGLELGSWDAASQQAELVAQHQDLQVLDRFAAGEQGEQLDAAAQREVGEFQQHRGWPLRGTWGAA